MSSWGFALSPTGSGEVDHIISQYFHKLAPMTDHRKYCKILLEKARFCRFWDSVAPTDAELLWKKLAAINFVLPNTSSQQWQ